MKKYNISAILLALGIQSSFAGTMGPVNSEYDFNGLYVGVQAGLLSLLTSTNETTVRTTFFGNLTENSSNNYTNAAVSFNGNVGYGLVHNLYYLGLKGSVTYSPIFHEERHNTSSLETYIVDIREHRREERFTVNDFRDSVTVNTLTLQPIVNLDLVLGYELFPHILPYLEGGVSWTNPSRKHLTTDTNRNSFGFNYTQTSIYYLNNYETGWNLGAGINYQPSPHWILTSEFVYTGFGSIGLQPQTTQILGRDGTRTFWYTENDKSLGLMAGIAYLCD